MRNKFFYKITILFILIFHFVSVSGQEKEEKENLIKMDVGVDFLSRYVWRGQNTGGPAPSIQPSITFSIGNFSINACGSNSVGSNQMIQEADLTLSYFTKYFSVSFVDYFLPNDTVFNNKYFEFDKDATTHVFETQIKITPFEKIPAYLSFSMNIFGADMKNKDGDIVYSKYLELGYSKDCGKFAFDVFAGAALDEPNEGKGYYANEKIGIINLGITATKNVEITEKFSLPIKTSVVVNPESENIYVFLGISF